MEVYVNFIVVIKVSFHQHEKNMILVLLFFFFFFFLFGLIRKKWRSFSNQNLQSLCWNYNAITASTFQNGARCARFFNFYVKFITKFRKKGGHWVIMGVEWRKKKPLGVETGSIDLQSSSTNPRGSLPLWPVDHAQPRLFKKHPKHGFYPLLKWHPEHETWVIFDKLKRDFRSGVRFHTLNKEY